MPCFRKERWGGREGKEERVKEKGGKGGGKGSGREEERRQAGSSTAGVLAKEIRLALKIELEYP